MIVAPEFKHQIGYLDIEALSRSTDVICCVDHELRLMAYNKAWIDFALKNDGESILSSYPLWTKLSEVGEEPIKTYLTAGYLKALQSNTTFCYRYECSSSQILRVFQQTAYPLIETRGLIISNHLVIEKPHQEEEVEFTRRFINQDDFLIQCQNCRKIRNPNDINNWYWVPALVKTPYRNISHSICPLCLDHYFPDIHKISY